jgi:hypothetical protein
MVVSKPVGLKSVQVRLEVLSRQQDGEMLVV